MAENHGLKPDCDLERAFDQDAVRTMFIFYAVGIGILGLQTVAAAVLIAFRQDIPRLPVVMIDGVSISSC